MKKSKAKIFIFLLPLIAIIFVLDSAAMAYGLRVPLLQAGKDKKQFTFNIGLATGGTTESLRKMLGLSDMLYNIYGRILDPEKKWRKSGAKKA